MVPPGKKWPTLRVRTTTSTRTESPRRTVGDTRSIGAITSTGGDSTVGTAPKLPDSSPWANVEASWGSEVRALAWPWLTLSPAGLGASATRARPKRSTVTWPSRRKSWVARSCSASPFTKGSAVFAAGKRWEWIFPSRAAGSFAATSGMWQSAHFWGLAG